MRVEIRVSAQIKDPYIIVCVGEITPEIRDLANSLENFVSDTNIIVVKKDEKLFILNPEDIQIVRTENNEMIVYDSDAERYSVQKRLYQIEQLLGNSFIRISKSAIVNILKISHVDVSFKNMFEIYMKNGVHEYISRRFLSDFKNKLGL